MVVKTQELEDFTKTGGVAFGRPASESAAIADADRYALEPLLSEYLLDLQVQGRAERTMEWYEEKLRAFLARSRARTLADVTAFELRRHLASEQERGLGREHRPRDLPMHSCVRCLGVP